MIYQAYRCLFTFRKKIIGLDDLLLDYFETGKDKLKVKPTKSNRRPREYGSDDENTDVRENEITFCKLFEDCEEKVIIWPDHVGVVQIPL